MFFMSAMSDLSCLSYSRPHRHAPELFAAGDARFEELVCQIIVVAEQAGVLMAERDDDGARQGGQIDHEARVEFFLRIPKDVGQDEAAFRVGVEHFDGLAGVAAHSRRRGAGRWRRGMFSEPGRPDPRR